MSRSWKILQSQEIFKTGFFRLRSDRCLLPDGREMPRYYVMEFPDWANIIPVTADGQIVFVEQYRHASATTELEIPGGSTHPASQEDPQLAAVRELLEETGYQAGRTELVLKHRPNPAMQNNWMHTFIAWDCQKVAEPTPDLFEDLSVVLHPISEIENLIRTGRIAHTIVVASLLTALPTLRAFLATQKG